jgi:hypothetical protein
VPQVTFEVVRDFAVKELWGLPAEVTDRTALAHDCRIAGLDGHDFMEKYAARFAVDLSGVDWVAYFGPEGLGVAWPVGVATYLWRRYLQGRPARDLVGLPELTLGHLVECANRGQWKPPGPAA